MFRIEIGETAQNMLQDAWWWYEQQLPGLGNRFENEVYATIEKLKFTPFHYSFINDNYRQVLLKHFPYKIIFEIFERDVIVFAIYHTNQDQEKSFDR